jgi:hypothetical protein
VGAHLCLADTGTARMSSSSTPSPAVVALRWDGSAGLQLAVGSPAGCNAGEGRRIAYCMQPAYGICRKCAALG